MKASRAGGLTTAYAAPQELRPMTSNRSAGYTAAKKEGPGTFDPLAEKGAEKSK